MLRRTPDGRQVNIRVDLYRALRDPRENIIIEPGDMLILQETPGEAMSRYANNVVTLNFITDLFRTGSSAGTAGALLPGQ